MSTRIMLAVLALASLGGGVAARAETCSGATTPPPEYEGGTHTDPVLGYWGATGLPEEAWVGAYYQDGYWFIDATDPTRPTYRSWQPYNQAGEARGQDVMIVGGASPSICVHSRLFSQWPSAESGDGCVIVGNARNSCSFRGGGTVGTAEIPPVPAVTTEVDLGGYVAAAQDWAIYVANGAGSRVEWGSSKGSPSGGIVTFAGGTRYYACVGTVNTARPPATACTSGPGALVAMHI